MTPAYSVWAISRRDVRHPRSLVARFRWGWWAVVRAKAMNAMPIGATHDHVVLRRLPGGGVVVAWHETFEKAQRRRLAVEARRLRR